MTDPLTPGAEERGLRLAAQDEEDLRALSATLQDAVARVCDLVFDPRRRAFTAVVNRFRWEDGEGAERVRAAVRIEGVVRVRSRGIKLDEPRAVANVLAVEFESEGEPPGGVLKVILSGGGEIAADVECIDVSLLDLTRPWRARAKPCHDEE